MWYPRSRSLRASMAALFVPFAARAVVPSRSHGEDRVLVRWRSQVPAHGRFAVGQTRGALNLSTVRVPAGSSVEATLAALRADPSVLYAERNVRRRILSIPAPNEPTWGQNDPRPDYTTRTYEQDVPPEYQIPYMWGLEVVGAQDAWSLFPGVYYTAQTKPANPLKVAVLDTGCDISHPDWINAGGTSADAAHGGQLDLAEAVDFADRDAGGKPTPLTDDHVGHGTFTCGIVGAGANNGGPSSPLGGAIGLAYSAQVLPIEVLNDAENGSVEDEIDGILYAVDHGAAIISISLGDYDYSQSEQDAVDYAWKHNVLVVAAAGNDGDSSNGGQNRPSYPAADDHVLAVAATGPSDTKASYSNTGKYVGVAAPGGDVEDAGVVLYDILPVSTVYAIWSTFPTHPYQLQTVTDPSSGETVNDYFQENYDYAPGTSAACPFVAALAALYAQKHGMSAQTPNFPTLVWQAIQRGADGVGNTANGGSSDQYGYGRINAPATLMDANTRNATVGGIIGRITSNTVPIPNASVTATNGTVTKSGTTTANGFFRIANLPAGKYTVTGNSPTTTGSYSVTVVAGADTPGTDFLFPWPPGDVDHDGRVTLADAVSAARMALGVDPADAGASSRGDVSPWTGTNGRTHGDGALTMADAREILRLAGGLTP